MLKTITRDAIPAALQKAERYRLLNDPHAAESICLDVLAIDPANESATVMLLLAITDQFGEELGPTVRRAREVLPRLQSEYERHYYEGIIHERAAQAKLRQGGAGSGPIVFQWLQQAMRCYQQAEALRPAGNDDAILRWNTCQRVIDANPRHVHAPADTEYEPALGE
jgi:hypothetical protein